VALLPSAIQAAREAARRNVSMNNVKQIMLALLNHEAAKKRFPAQANLAPDGKPLLSWRVHILPFTEEYELYKKFHLDEPWDSEHNKKLISKMPKLFASPTLPDELAKKGMASYVAPVGEKTIWDENKGLNLATITDGTSNTLAILEADAEHSVIWTKPDDLTIDWKAPVKGLELWKSGTKAIFLAAFCDGSVRAVSDKVDPALMKKLLQKDDGEVIGEVP